MCKKIALFSENSLTRHPYVQRINRQAFSKASGADGGFKRYYQSLANTVAELSYQPKISIVLPVYNVKESYFRECLKSVELQVYENWELCIVDDASTEIDVRSIVDEFSASHKEKYKFARNKINRHISVSSNEALKLASGDFIALLDHDDRLLPNALAEAVRFINLHNQPDILYSDESRVSEQGAKETTYHKPGWSPFMHLSVNYTTHLSIYRTDLVRSLGGFREGFEGSQDHDLMLRMTEASNKPIVHIPLALYQWRAHPKSTARTSTAKPYTATAGIKAVSEACQRRGTPAEVSFEPETLHYRVKFKVKDPAKLVSIIIPSKNGFDLIEPCLRSLFEKTTYKSFEVIIIDHNSDCSKCINLFSNYKERHPKQFKVIPYTGYFNFAKMNNLGVKESNGDYVLLLNNDTEVISPEWLTEMVSLAQFEQVGAVGPKLLYPDKKIQHGGLMGFGFHIAGHAGLNKDDNDPLYYHYLQTTHETLGVTGACLLVRKSIYLEVGGLEPSYVPNGFGDVDFCLKVRKAGYDNIYTPYARLFHKESPSRKASFELFERYYILEKWGKDLLMDEYVNLSMLKHPHFQAHEHYATQEISSLYFDALLNGNETI